MSEKTIAHSFWVEYPIEGEDGVICVQLRPPATREELDTLTLTRETLVTEAQAKIAPFVTDWNLDREDGTALPPPAESNGKTFDHIPNEVFWKVWLDVRFYGHRAAWPGPEAWEGRSA